MPLIEIENLSHAYAGARRPSHADAPAYALRDISLAFDRGASVGIVGETGSGKSTLIRLLSGLFAASKGTIRFDGRPIGEWINGREKEFRRRSQIMFQSTNSAFDPRLKIATSVAEPARALLGRRPRRAELEALMNDVGLEGKMLDRYPHQLSGGQLQRVGLARALAVEPEVLYVDEPTSALDVSVQAQVLALIAAVRQARDVTLVMVSHDLAVVSHVCEEVAVLKDGVLVELGTTESVFSRPAHPYTAALLEAADAVAVGAGRGDQERSSVAT
jgi:ABC-type glutathione transport system ATPase component